MIAISQGRGSDTIAADRRRLPGGALLAMTLATALSVGAAAFLISSDSGESGLPFFGGLFAGAMAVVALRSVSVRTVVRWMCVIGALLALRFGDLGTQRADGGVVILGWVAATGTAFVLAARATRWSHPPATEPVAAGEAGAHVGRSGRSGGGRLVRLVAVVVCLAASAATGVGPMIAPTFSSGPRDGDRADFGRESLGTPMAATERLDMTRRPSLTDRLVLTVQSPRPGFWRNQTFDRWDGSAWTRDEPRVVAVPPDGVIVASEDHLTTDDRPTVSEEFRIETAFANALPLSPTPEVVTSTSPLGQFADGSVVSPTPLGRGATYTVESRRFDGLTAAALRASDASGIPSAVSDRYAATPVATDRVKALAEEIAAGTTSNYDKVLAVEAWLDANTEYSLDAPLAPAGSDVVDDFLFESKIGWCEQIASSLTVLLRLQGVPARLAVGYVPGARDAVTGRYRVSEKDAHAWTEVWFPEIGWVPFDPTASVPLSGDASDTLTAVGRFAPLVLLIVGVAIALGGVVLDLVRSVTARRLRARSGRSTRRARQGSADWPAATEAVLERLGEGWGRPRDPTETTRAYAADLADRRGDPRLVEVARTIDRHRFAPEPPAPEELAAATGVLADLSDG